MIDCGSKLSFIKPEVAEKLKVQSDGKHVDVGGADGKPLVTNGRVILEVQMTIGDTTKKVNFYFVVMRNLCVDVLFENSKSYKVAGQILWLAKVYLVVRSLVSKLQLTSGAKIARFIYRICPRLGSAFSVSPSFWLSEAVTEMHCPKAPYMKITKSVFMSWRLTSWLGEGMIDETPCLAIMLESVKSRD